MEGGESSRPDPGLDLCSDAFDAERSLAVPDTANVAVPFPDIQAYPHLSKCMPLVPPHVRKYVQDNYDVPAEDGTSVEEIARRDAKRAFIIQRTAAYYEAVNRAETADPILRIVRRVRKGPLMMLRRVFEAGEQVDVMLRHAAGVRGVLRASLRGFDKFMNLLLADAREVFVTRQRVVRVTARAAPPPHAAHHDSARGGEDDVTHGGAGGRGEEGGGGGEEVRTRSGWQQVLRHRALSRVLLRGDHVVCIQRASGPVRMPAPLRRFQPQCDAFFADDGS